MAYKIGFTAENGVAKGEETVYVAPSERTAPRKSVVRVHFPSRDTTLSYYNDSFDLRCGDIVFVDGKLYGVRGRVTEVSYSFKIKLSDYKRVIALADTDVRGRFYMAGSHFVTFDRGAIPREKTVTWFKSPPREDEEYVCGRDPEDSFPLSCLEEMALSEAAAKKGHSYYMDNRVVYLSLDGTRGYAIVEGGESYEVEFEYRDGEIHGLVCSCFSSARCKHGLAAMLQLRETLDLIEKNYIDEYERSGYFAAITKGVLFGAAIDKRERGSFTL